MALPAPGYLSNAERTNAEMKQALEDQRNYIEEMSERASEADASPPAIEDADNKKVVTILHVLQVLRSAPALDVLRPVGSHYIQFAESDGSFSSAKAPATLFGGTWTLKFNAESVFFRTEGALSAAERSGGVQGDAIRNITAQVGGGDYSFLWSGSGATAAGAFELGGTNRPHSASSTGGSIPSTLYFNASKVVPTAAENRVTNRLIRVWERTA